MAPGLVGSSKPKQATNQHQSGGGSTSETSTQSTSINSEFSAATANPNSPSIKIKVSVKSSEKMNIRMPEGSRKYQTRKPIRPTGPRLASTFGNNVDSDVPKSYSRNNFNSFDVVASNSCGMFPVYNSIPTLVGVGRPAGHFNNSYQSRNQKKSEPASSQFQPRQLRFDRQGRQDKVANKMAAGDSSNQQQDGNGDVAPSGHIPQSYSASSDNRNPQEPINECSTVIVDSIKNLQLSTESSSSGTQSPENSVIVGSFPTKPNPISPRKRPNFLPVVPVWETTKGNSRELANQRTFRLPYRDVVQEIFASAAESQRRASLRHYANDAAQKRYDHDASKETKRNNHVLCEKAPDNYKKEMTVNVEQQIPLPLYWAVPPEMLGNVYSSSVQQGAIFNPTALPYSVPPYLIATNANAQYYQCQTGYCQSTMAAPTGHLMAAPPQFVCSNSCCVLQPQQCGQPLLQPVPPAIQWSTGDGFQNPPMFPAQPIYPPPQQPAPMVTAAAPCQVFPANFQNCQSGQCLTQQVMPVAYDPVAPPPVSFSGFPAQPFGGYSNEDMQILPNVRNHCLIPKTENYANNYSQHS